MINFNTGYTKILLILLKKGPKTEEDFAAIVHAGPVDLRTYLSQRREALVRAARGNAPKEWALWELPSPMSEATARIRELFTDKIRYLGPLRDEPKDKSKDDDL